MGSECGKVSTYYNISYRVLTFQSDICKRNLILLHIIILKTFIDTFKRTEEYFGVKKYWDIKNIHRVFRKYDVIKADS